MKKKILSLLMAISMLISLAVVPMTYAEEETVEPVTKTMVNVAKNKYVYSGGGNAGEKAQKLTDGKKITDENKSLVGFTPAGAGTAETALLPSGAQGPVANGQQDDWFMIDLGRQHKIKEVRLYSGRDTLAPTDMQYFEIQGSNTETFDEYETLLDIEGTVTEGVHYPYCAAIQSEPKPYRYIRLQRTASSYYYISEMEVYADVTLTEVSIGKEVKVSSETYPETYPAKAVVDGAVDESTWIVEDVPAPHYLTVDLGKEYPVAWIDMVGRVIDPDNTATRHDWTVYGSKSEPTADTITSGTQMFMSIIATHMGNYPEQFPAQKDGYLSMPVYSGVGNQRYISFYKTAGNVALSEVRAYVMNPEVFDIKTGNNIVITFSDEMDADSVKSAITLKNLTTGENVDLTGKIAVSSNEAVIADVDFEADNKYIVSVSKIAENDKGVALDKDYEESFTAASKFKYTETKQHVNVAKNKYVYSGGGNAGVNAQKLTDGKKITDENKSSVGFTPAGAGTAETALLPSGAQGPVAAGQQNDWFMIDLGRQHKVKEVRLYSGRGSLAPTDMQYFEIQGSNTETFDEYDVLMDIESTVTDGVHYPYYAVTQDEAKPYRYIRLQRTASSYYYISEMEVYADITVSEVSREKEVYANVETYPVEYPATAAVDGTVDSAWLVESGTAPYYLTVDLGEEYPVAWIDMVGRVIDPDNAATRQNWTVYGSKEKPAADTITSGTQLFMPIIGTYLGNYPEQFPAQKDGYLSMPVYSGGAGKGLQNQRYITFYKTAGNVALSEVRAYVMHPEVYKVTTEGNIEVTFSDDMNVETVKKAISLKNVNGEAIDIYDAITVSANKAVISVSELDERQEYVLSVAKTAKNNYGIGLADEFKYEFDTYGTPSDVPYTKTVNKNVAQNKYVYSNDGNAGNKAQALTDGRTNLLNPASYCADNRVVSNETTNDLSGVLPGVDEKLPGASKEINTWYIIDLGRQYKITGAELYSITGVNDDVSSVVRYMSNVEIQLSNTIDFAEYETIMDIDDATTDNFPSTSSSLAVPKYYRYVRLWKNKITEHGWSEVKIFADINLTEVSRGKTATASKSDHGTLPSVTVDGVESGAWLVETDVPSPKYLSVDLGEELPVSWVEMAARVTSTDNVATRFVWDIYGSDEAPTTETVQSGTKLIPSVIQGNSSGIVNELFPRQSEGCLSMPIYQSVYGEKFRHITYYKQSGNTALSEVRAFVTAPEMSGAYITEDGIAIEFSEAMNPASLNKGSIKLYDSEGNSVAWANGALSGNVFVISDAELESGATYKVSVNNLAENALGVSVAPLNEMTFKNSFDYEMTGFELVDSEGNAITAESLSKTADDVMVKLNIAANAKPVKGMLVMAFYNSGHLVKVEYAKINVKEGTNDVLTVSGAWDEETVYTKVKAFLWDGNQSPYESELEIAVK